MAISDAVKQAIYLRRFVKDLDFELLSRFFEDEFLMIIIVSRK